MRLTKRSVEALEVTGRRYEVRDDDLPGFLVRVGVTGEKSFYLMYRAGKGRGAAKRRLALGSFPAVTVEQARKLAREKLALVTMGADPAETLREEKATRSVASVLEQFLAEHVRAKLKPSTVRCYEQQAAAHILPLLGAFKITEVSARQVSGLHHSLRQTPYQANRVLSTLSKFFNWCEMAGFRDRGTNPVFGVERFKECKRTVFMGKAEVEAIGASIARLEPTGNFPRSWRACSRCFFLPVRVAAK